MPPRKGRASATNPPTRFERLHVVEDPGALDEEERRQIPTVFYRDATRSILARNDSPDIPFTYSLNPYRGCEHGCIYCYARPSHEYLGFSAGLDFETKILVKEQAPTLLDRTFRKASWEPQVVSVSGNTDPYQPAERSLRLTRRCLDVFRRFRNPVSIITKNHLVTRDIDILAELATLHLVHVTLTVTSLRDDVVGAMEPRTSRPARRLQAIEALAKAGVRVGVMVGPVVPGLTEDELPAIMKEAAARGATTASYVMLRLPGPVKDLFFEWLARTFPDRARRVERRIRAIRGPDYDDVHFGRRMRGRGEWAHTIRSLFKLTCRRLHLNEDVSPLATHHFRRDGGTQYGLFDSGTSA